MKPAIPVHAPQPNLHDFQLTERCLYGDEEAIRTLQAQFRPQVIGFLMRSGAELSQAEEIVDQMWADLLVVAPGETAKLARYDGSCRLATWLNTVAINRLLSARRSQKRSERYLTMSLDADRDENGEKATKAELSAPDVDESELPLINLLGSAIQEAFGALSAENFVLLQLAYGDGLRLRELGLIWGCNPATISRRLDQASEEVSRVVLAHLRTADPLLEITWSDFDQLCRTTSLGALGFK